MGPLVSGNIVWNYISIDQIFGEGNGTPLQCSCLEIPGTGESGGLCLWGRTELDMTEVIAAAA